MPLPPPGHLAARFSATYGHFDSASGTYEQTLPHLTDDPYPDVTSVHEAIHRDLTAASELGYFERLVHLVFRSAQQSSTDGERRASKVLTLLRRPRPTAAFLHDMGPVLDLLIGCSWQCHESAATFSSLVLLVPKPEEKERYLALLPGGYRSAYRLLDASLGFLLETGYDPVVVTQMGKCIAHGSLNVPILDGFRSVADVNEQKVGQFLEIHHPDRRQKQLLQMMEANVARDLAQAGTDWLDQLGGLDDCSPSEEIQRVSSLDLFLLEALQALAPAIVLWRPPKEQAARLNEHHSAWRRSLQRSGLSAAARTRFRFRDPSGDGSSEIVGTYHHETIGFDVSRLRYRRDPFERVVPAAELSDHIGSVTKLKGDFLVRLVTSHGLAPIRVGENESVASHEMALITWPWQWEPGDPSDPIWHTTDPTARRSLFRFRLADSAEALTAFEGARVVWVRSCESEALVSIAGFALPNGPGWNLFFRERSSAADIVDFAKTCLPGTRVFFLEHYLRQGEPVFCCFFRPTSGSIDLFPVTNRVQGLVSAPLVLAGMVQADEDELRESAIPFATDVITMLTEAICMLLGKA
jgi:hypothetical protein